MQAPLGQQPFFSSTLKEMENVHKTDQPTGNTEQPQQLPEPQSTWLPECASWCPAASVELRGPAQMQELPETSSFCTSMATQISILYPSMCGFKQELREFRVQWNSPSQTTKAHTSFPPTDDTNVSSSFPGKLQYWRLLQASIPTPGITSQSRTWLHTQASASSSVSVGPLQIYYSSLKLVIQVELTAGKANLPTQPLRASLTTALRALIPHSTVCFISQITSLWRWKTLQLL